MPRNASSTQTLRLPYFYADTIADFLAKSKTSILGSLTENSGFDTTQEQRDAWLGEIALLREILPSYCARGSVFFEFSIPRMGRRIDVVLLLDGVVFVLEFKVGKGERDDAFGHKNTEQTWDYALDLKNFHRESHELSIVPVLVETEAKRVPVPEFFVDHDKLFRPVFASAKTLAGTLSAALEKANRRKNFDVHAWKVSAYAPTPTIIEAARALYANHSVEEISRSDASAKNLSETCAALEKIIADCKANQRKAICFVTGVPGAGKTLVGLNTATHESADGTPAVYLSGNGPLVKVLTEALARDKVDREKAALRNAQKRAEKSNPGKPCSKKLAESEVKEFVQLVHHYRDDCLLGAKIENGKIVADVAFFHGKEKSDKNFIPAEHVAIFDEAQRAWTHEELKRFMQQKKHIANFPCSEAAFLISCLNRHDDWAVVVCLVGGGQEINRGEAGISAWIEAVREHFPNWCVFVSPRLEETDEKVSSLLRGLENVERDNALHLAVSMRSFRAENLSAFVHALLDFEVEKARTLLSELREKYPIALTRDPEKAKAWLREHARGSERFGLLVSSKAERLKPLAIDVRCKPSVVHWFLARDTDVRASNFLEDAVSEFDIQGLEVDWACIVWDADFRYSTSAAGEPAWTHFEFKHGDRWNQIRQESRQEYQKNAYRVLLTRARQGMVICVPAGEKNDNTRKPAFYDTTCDYLRSLGIEEI